MMLSTAAAVVLAAGCEQGAPERHPPAIVPLARPAPPPLSGGTLLVTADRTRAVAADPESHTVWVVQLDGQRLEHAIALEQGDEPGRVVEDAAGRVHVVLRGTGEVATIDLAKGELLRRVPVCTSPRGLAFDEATDLLHVACAEGKLVSLAASSGEVARSVNLDIDLRDVVVQGDRLLVSRFRSAELYAVDAAGEVTGSGRPPAAHVLNVEGKELERWFSPGVAYRAIAWPAGGVLMVHQRALDNEVQTTEPDGYGGSEGDPCGGIVHGALSRFELGADGAVLAPSEAFTRLGGALPVDVAISADGAQIAAVMAGSNQVVVLSPDRLDDSADSACSVVDQRFLASPTSVAFAGSELVVFSRAPAAIELPFRGIHIALGEVPDGNREGYEQMYQVDNPGFSLFHVAPSGTVACASCHPEGREDGHVWRFSSIGPRRSQSLRGGVTETAPLHWDGDMDDMSAIMEEVFVHRMGGFQAGPDETRAIEQWVDALPALPPLRDPNDAAAVRGQAIFERADVGCAQCHSGPRLTNNRNESIGKAEVLQVPSLLGVAWRGPFMHDGCAASLPDRFDPTCGGPKHGDVTMLDATELSDLISYLQSL